MVGKWVRFVDWLVAVFLMFLFPAVCIHVTMRGRHFDACAQRVKEYGEMIQKQGYLSLKAAGALLLQKDGLLDGVTITIWEESDGKRKLLTLPQMEAEACSYMGTKVYPLSDGDGLLFILRLPADGFERAFYHFCGWERGREYWCFFAVRDGLLERIWEGGEGKGEVISLYDAFYDPVSRNCIHAVCAGSNPVSQGVGAAEGGTERRSGGGRSSRIYGDPQRREAAY